MIGADLVRAAALLSIPLAAFAGRPHAAAALRGRRRDWHRDRAVPPRRPRVHHRPRRAEAPARRKRQAGSSRRGRRDLRSGARRRAGRVADRPHRDRRRCRVVRRVGALVARIDRRERIAVPSAATSFVDDVRTGIRVVWGNATVRALFLATATLTFCGSFMASLYTLFALSDLGLSPAALGLTIGCGGVGGLAGAALAARLASRWGIAAHADWRLARRRRGPDAGPARAGRARDRDAVPGDHAGDRRRRAHGLPHQRDDVRQRLLPPEALGRAAATWQVAAAC